MEKYFDFIQYSFDGNVLVCRGKVEDTLYKYKYEFEIRCVAGASPYCKIIEPADIIPSVDIHMYDDHSVCLFFPPDLKWNGMTPLYKLTIPWLFEWIHFYELYLVNGFKWEGRESPFHITEADKDICEDRDD